MGEWRWGAHWQAIVAATWPMATDSNGKKTIDLETRETKWTGILKEMDWVLGDGTWSWCGGNHWRGGRRERKALVPGGGLAAGEGGVFNTFWRRLSQLNDGEDWLFAGYSSPQWLPAICTSPSTSATAMLSWPYPIMEEDQTGDHDSLVQISAHHFFWIFRLKSIGPANFCSK